MKLLIVITFLAISGPIGAQTVDTLKFCLTRQQIGVGGYDPVSYFQGSQPVLGQEQFKATFEGVTYLFSSESNRKKFLSNPVDYLPAFGGWCSMTLAMGRATTPKYDNFVILRKRLYLFERTVSVNGRELWMRDPKANEAIASANYDAYRKTGKIK